MALEVDPDLHFGKHACAYPVIYMSVPPFVSAHAHTQIAKHIAKGVQGILYYN